MRRGAGNYLTVQTFLSCVASAIGMSTGVAPPWANAFLRKAGAREGLHQTEMNVAMRSGPVFPMKSDNWIPSTEEFSWPATLILLGKAALMANLQPAGLTASQLATCMTVPLRSFLCSGAILRTAPGERDSVTAPLPGCPP
jgi:hypothetical protein